MEEDLRRQGSDAAAEQFPGRERYSQGMATLSINDRPGLPACKPVQLDLQHRM